MNYPVRFCIHLHTRIFIIVEKAAQHFVPVGFDAVML
jgi:hypothetical protein